MGKKTPLVISIVALLLGGLTSTTAWADEKKVYTFEEMQALSRELDAVIEAYCAKALKDSMCREEYIWSMENDGYRDISAYEAFNFYITAFNPSKKTIKAYYRDENLHDKYRNRDDYIHDIVNLYIVQLDDGYNRLSSYASDIESGKEDPFRRDLLIGFEHERGPNWFPVNTEIEISTPNLSFAPETDDLIYATYKDTSGSSSGLVFKTSSCLESPAYEDGMECQIRFSDGELIYVPVRPETPSLVPTATGEIENAVDVSAVPDSNPNYQKDPSPDWTNVPSTPNTGYATREEKDSSEENSPWWILALPIATVMIVVIAKLLAARKKK